MFSILILTRNEARNLPHCLASVAWCDDVVVLDSYSTDATTSIAARSGARVVQRAFDDFGSQRNFALTSVQFKHPWTFHLDADERFNEALRLECEEVIARDQHSAYFVPNKIIFLGKWIKHSSQYPFPQVRLVKLGEVSFAKAGHGQREDQAHRGIGHIRTPYEHFNFSKGIREWVEKHNRYSDEEAELALHAQKLPLRPQECFSPDPVIRRRALKRVHGKMPVRWAFTFSYLYFLRLGFLDGYPGFAYCLLMAFYDFLITVKVREKALGALAINRNCSVRSADPIQPNH